MTIFFVCMDIGCCDGYPNLRVGMIELIQHVVEETNSSADRVRRPRQDMSDVDLTPLTCLVGYTKMHQTRM